VGIPGMGPGRPHPPTQAMILIVPELLSSPPDVTTRALLMGAAWVINLVVAEYFIRRRALSTRPTPRAH
jgi:hypothetical protein